MSFKIREYIEPSGQRNAVIVDTKTGLPEFWPALYVSSKLRASGFALSTKVAQLNAILCFYHWVEIRGVELESRIASGQGFSRNEIDALVSLLRSRISDLPQLNPRSSNILDIGSAKAKSSDIWKALEEQPRQIGASSYNDRLVYVGNYVEWLCDYLSDQDPHSSQQKRETIQNSGIKLKAALKSMKSVEPNTTFDAPRDIMNKDVRTIIERIKPFNPLNPWQEPSTQIRNYALILVLLDTGLRSGELLSLKPGDIIFGKKKAKGIKVRRRQGSKDDPRKRQPSTKRDEREVPLSDGAFKALDLYVTEVRNRIPKASQTSYLFVSVGNSNVGQPLGSISSITDKIREETGIDLTPHKLRHAATWRYCVAQKKQGRKWDEFVDQLCLKFGWSNPESPSVRHYAKRYRKEEMFEAAINEQDQMSAEIEEAVETVKLEEGKINDSR